jgi:hypothetical protein
VLALALQPVSTDVRPSKPEPKRTPPIAARP